MIINPLLSNIARTTGPNVRLPDGTLSRNINYYLPLLEAAASGSGDVYAAIFETYENWTDTPPGALPDTPVEALALLGVQRAQQTDLTAQFNLFGLSNSGTGGTDTTTFQAAETQFGALTSYLVGPDGLFAFTTTALNLANGSTLTVSNVKDTTTSVETVRDALDVNLTAWSSYAGVWGLATPSNLTLSTTALGAAATETNNVIASVNLCTTVGNGAPPVSTTPSAASALDNITLLLADILEYINANPGALITGSGAPFATLQSWAAAQGI